MKENEQNSSEFDSTIPLPVKGTSLGKFAYLLKMKVGDSCLVKDTPSYMLSPHLSNLYKKTGKKFTQKKESDAQRVWRVE